MPVTAPSPLRTGRGPARSVGSRAWPPDAPTTAPGPARRDEYNLFCRNLGPEGACAGCGEIVDDASATKTVAEFIRNDHRQVAPPPRNGATTSPNSAAANNR